MDVFLWADLLHHSVSLIHNTSSHTLKFVTERISLIDKMSDGERKVIVFNYWITSVKLNVIV